MAYHYHEVKEAPIVRKVPPRTLPLEFCYLAHDYYEFLTTHGLKDFAKVTAISCVRNNLAKDSHDYFVTTVTHTDTADGKETSIAFYEFRPAWLDYQHSENYGVGFGQLREIAERHGLPIAFYFESESEKGELDGMTEAGIEWRHAHDFKEMP